MSREQQFYQDIMAQEFVMGKPANKIKEMLDQLHKEKMEEGYELSQ